MRGKLIDTMTDQRCIDPDMMVSFCSQSGRLTYDFIEFS
jgi:hypothetical protein